MDVGMFAKKPVIGIMRGVAHDELEPLIEAAVQGGLSFLEITMNTANAAALIRQAVAYSKKRVSIGAGTVLTLDEVKRVVDAGASFIVSPVCVPEVVGYCVNDRIPVFPGALTPHEIYTAWQAGATMVKVFPAQVFGPRYFKQVKGPLNEVKLLACGGVTTDNMGEYAKAGADGVAFGASILKEDFIEQKKFNRIADAIRDFMQSAAQAFSTR